MDSEKPRNIGVPESVSPRGNKQAPSFPMRQIQGSSEQLDKSVAMGSADSAYRMNKSNANDNLGIPSAPPFDFNQRG